MAPRISPDIGVYVRDCSGPFVSEVSFSQISISALDTKHTTWITEGCKQTKWFEPSQPT